jgi:hypothetical protein
MSKMIITKEQIHKMRKKLRGEELHTYHDQVKKSAHIFKNKKKYDRKKKNDFVK